MGVSDQVLAALIAASVSMTAALAALAVSLASLRQGKAAQRAAAQQGVTAAYDHLVDYRVHHPQVMKLSRDWDPSFLERIYLQRSDDDKRWVIYYGYVELCIGYCNAVLDARQRGLLHPEAFLSQHRSLLKLLLTEHNPIISDLCREGKFISEHIRAFRKELEAEGWNWDEEYRALVGFGIKSKEEGNP